MTILNKGMLSMDVMKFNKVYEEYHGRVYWKLALLIEQASAKRLGGKEK